MKDILLEKYIRESIRQINEINLNNAIKSLNKDSTYGDLKSILNAISVSSKTKKGIEVGKAVLGFTPLGGALDVVDLVQALYKVKDKDRPNNFLADFDIDDEVSQIVDNNLEEDFIKELVKKIQNISDSKKLGDFNMTNYLKEYLASRFNNRTVVGFPKK